MSSSDELLDFIKEYKSATNSHDFANVEPLIAKDAVYWFSDGSYNGIDEIKEAFISTWGRIQNETYSISDINWLNSSETLAVCIYKFSWKGIVEGQEKSGTGRSTNVIAKVYGEWQMLHEHLSSSR